MEAITHNTETDTTGPLWDILYKVRMPYLQTTSVEYIKMFGMPTSGDKGTDLEMANQWITTYQSIASLTEHYSNGVSIKIVDPSDPKRIYEAVAAHLEAWKSQITYGINIGGAPIEDLIKLDNFANAIYEHAKYHMVAKPGGGAFSDAINKLNPFAKTKMFRNNYSASERTKSTVGGMNKYSNNASDSSGIQDRESLGDFLKNSLNTTSRYRG